MSALIGDCFASLRIVCKAGTAGVAAQYVVSVLSRARGVVLRGRRSRRAGVAVAQQLGRARRGAAGGAQRGRRRHVDRVLGRARVRRALSRARPHAQSSPPRRLSFYLPQARFKTACARGSDYAVVRREHLHDHGVLLSLLEPPSSRLRSASCAQSSYPASQRCTRCATGRRLRSPRTTTFGSSPSSALPPECAAAQCILVEHIFDLDASRNHSATLGITSTASDDGYDTRDSANGAWPADVPN